MITSALIAAAVCLAAQRHNELFETLTTQGVPLAGGAHAPLPLPALADGLDAEAQRKALEKITDINHPLDALLRRSIVSPFVLKIQNHPKYPNIWQVDTYFVAYGDFEKITADKSWQNRFQLFSGGGSQDGPERKAVVLSPDDLTARQIAAPENGRMRYSHAETALFDRVLLGITTRLELARGPESALIASVLDERFADDEQFPNFWQKLSREAGQREPIGPRQPYHGLGSYLKATKLREPPEAIFVEHHLLFDEPEGWFNGANLLRSKLPILVQDNVRKLRREAQNIK